MKESWSFTGASGVGVIDPESDLYVYVLKGKVDRVEEACVGPSFIGVWIEEDSSFLFFSGPSEDQVVRLIIANIHYDVIEKIIRRISPRRVKWVALSGLMRGRRWKWEHALKRRVFVCTGNGCMSADGQPFSSRAW